MCLPEPSAALAEELSASGCDARYLALDVTREEDWLRAVRFVDGQLGRLDVLVNNAGIIARRGVMDTTLDDWQRVLNVNVTGAFLGTQYMAPLMRDSGGGAIVNVSSTAGLMAHGDAAYTTSKWALRGFTKTSALELVGWGIRVNSVHPATIATATDPMRRRRAISKRIGTPFRWGVKLRPTKWRKSSYFLASEGDIIRDRRRDRGRWRDQQRWSRLDA